MDATSDFLKGCRVTIEGFVHRDEAGDEVPDVFFVIGKSATQAGYVAVQDVIDGQIDHVPADLIEVINAQRKG